MKKTHNYKHKIHQIRYYYIIYCKMALDASSVRSGLWEQFDGATLNKKKIL